MKLTLIRHGITEGNAKRLFYGAADISLAQKGIDALYAMKETHCYPTATRYYTSGMLRTEQTFAILYGDTPHTAIPELHEMDFGIFEMRPESELIKDPVFLKWGTEGDVEENICPGGESFRQMDARVAVAIAPVLASDEDAVCVIHGGVTDSLLEHFFPSEQYKRYYRAPEPGHGYQITFENGKAVSYVPVPFKK